MKGKLKFVLPLVALLVLGGAYKTVLAKPAPEPKHKVDGQVYVLPKEFLVNLDDERYAKLTVALVLPHDEPVAPAEADQVERRERVARRLFGELEFDAEPGDEICPSEWRPVCSCQGETLSNACAARVRGAEVAYEGSCLDDLFASQ